MTFTAIKSEPIKPEYVLVLEQTPHWGELHLLLYNNGTKLMLIKVLGEIDKTFYETLGAPKPELTDYDDSKAQYIRADPGMQLLLHGERRMLGDVVDDLYGRITTFNDMPEGDRRSWQMSRALHKKLELVEPQDKLELLTKMINDPSTMSLESLVESFTVLGAPKASRYGFLNFRIGKQSREKIYKKKVDELLKGISIESSKRTLNEETDYVRQSLIQAGIAMGKFPPDYGDATK